MIRPAADMENYNPNYEYYVPSTLTKRETIVDEGTQEKRRVMEMDFKSLLELVGVLEVDLSGTLGDSDIRKRVIEKLADGRVHESSKAIIAKEFKVFKGRCKQAAAFISEYDEFYETKFPSYLKKTDTEVHEKMQQAKDNLNDQKTTIVVCGDVSSGKSLFLNLMLEHDVLPSTAEACTTAITEMTWPAEPESPSIQCYSPSTTHAGRDKVNSYAVPMISGTQADASKTKQLLEDVATKIGDSGSNDFFRVLFEWPHGLLEYGVRLVDTPGMNDDEELDSRVADYLPSAIGCIVLINLDAGGVTNSVKSLIHTAIDCGVDPDSFLFIGSKVDALNTAKDRERMIKKVQSDLALLIGRRCDNNFVPMNLFGAFKGLTQYGIMTTHLKQFNLRLKEFLQRTFRAKLKRSMDLLFGHTGIVSRASKFVRMKISDMTLNDEELGLKKKRLEAALHSAKEEKNTMVENLLLKLRKVETELVDYLLSIFRDDSLDKKLANDSGLRKLDLKGYKVTSARELVDTHVARVIETILREQLPKEFAKKKEFIKKELERDFKLMENYETEVNTLLYNTDKEGAGPSMDAADMFNEMKLEIRLSLPERIFKRLSDTFGLKMFTSVGNPDEFKHKRIVNFLKRLRTPEDRARETCHTLIEQVFPSGHIHESIEDYFQKLIQYNTSVYESIDDMLIPDEDRAELEKLAMQLMGINERLAAFYVESLGDWEFDYDQVKRVDDALLGQGAYGAVYKVQYDLGLGEGEQIYAMKEMLPQPGTFTNFMAERKTLKALSQNKDAPVVRYYGATVSPKGNLCLLMELVAHGDIASYVRDFEVDYPTKVHICLKAAEALKYMSDEDYIHRDIKGANLLLGEDWDVKIADFGLATTVEDATRTRGSGTLLWMAPEIMPADVAFAGYYALEPSGKEVDIYSFGAVMYEIFTEKLPFFDQIYRVAPLEFMEKVKNGKMKPNLCSTEFPPVPEDYAELMTACLSYLAKDRPTWEVIVDTLQRIKNELQSSSLSESTVEAHNPTLDSTTGQTLSSGDSNFWAFG